MLTAGVAQLDITPPLGTHLRGYFETRTAARVHDPLFVRSFALERDGKSLALAVCDVIGLDRKYLDPAKTQIAATCGLAPEQVLIACTHTHTGPETGDDPYTQFLAGRVADCVRLAWQSRDPAQVGWGRATEGRVAFNRRYRMADGTFTNLALHVEPRTCYVRLSDAELAKRAKQWKAPAPRYRTGVLAKYASMATSADTGAVLKWD